MAGVIVVGVPEMAPLTESRVSPVGSRGFTLKLVTVPVTAGLNVVIAKFCATTIGLV